MDQIAPPPIAPERITEAHAAIAPYIRRTPVIETDGAVLKLECLQHAGSFKPRGAFWHLLTREVPEAGLVAASGGNHGAAVAYAAAQLGHRARIFVPELASPAKIALIRRLGGEVVVTGAAYADALRAADACQAETGALSLHAYDAAETVEGQGTVAREFECQADLDTILIAVGGGGLIAGAAAWLHGRVKLVAVEPETACCFHAARQAGQPQDVEVSGLAADSLGARRLGTLCHGLSAHIAESLLVSDAEIAEAQRWCWQALNLAVEPGGAAALAALRAGRYAPAAGERVGVVMCGANVGLATLDALNGPS
ncbi:MAG: serine/threonine dehydratase [Pseudomonadota bacterium]